MKCLSAAYAMVFAICAAATPLSAADLRGRVVDPTGAAVPNSQVRLTSSNNSLLRLESRTTPEGSFAFERLAPGDYLLEGTAEGFGASGAQRIHLNSGQSQSIDLTLEVAALSSTVEVTAAATPLTAAQIARSTDVIEAADLHRISRTHIGEALQFLPGIRVQRLGGPGAFTRVLARGLRSYDTALLIDGFRLRDAASPQGDATAFLGDLVVVDPDRIEVLRGAGASLYGTHASGAAINLVSNSGGGPWRGDLSAEGGGLGLMRGVARTSGSLFDQRLQLSAGLAHLNVLEGLDGNDRHRNTSAQGSAGFFLRPETKLTARVFASNAFTQLNVAPYALPAASAAPTGVVTAIPNVTFAPAPNDPDSRRESHYLTGLFALHHAFTPRTQARFAWQTLTTLRDNRDGPGGPRFQPSFNNSAWLEGRLDTLQARIDTSLTPRVVVSAGYEWERERFDSRTTDENPNPASRINAQSIALQKSHSAFGQTQFRLLADRLQISLSGRYQAFSLDRPEFAGGASVYQQVGMPDAPRALTGDASIAYFLRSTGTKLRAHVGNGFRAPSLYERFGSFFSFGNFAAYGDPRLRPERLLSTEGGVDQYLWRDRIRLRGTYFYTRIQENIIFSFDVAPATDPFGRFGGYANSGGGLARGLELGADLQPRRGTDVQLSYTYTNADERQGFRSLRIPDHSFTLRGSQALTRRLDVAFDLLASSSYLFSMFAVSSSRDLRFDGPLRADLAVNYTVPLTDRTRLRFFTRIENVLNTRRFEDGFPTPRAWAVGGLKLLF
jgi:vitamin B12 transporter